MRKLIILVLIALSNSILAQDQIAKKILDRLQTSMKSYKNTTINFDFVLENKNLNIKDTQTGTLILEGDKFQLIMDNQTIINNGETQWVYLANMNEVQILQHDVEDDMMNLNKLFSNYEEDYKYTYVGNKKKHLQIINLYPKKSNEFFKINIAIDSITDQLKRIVIHDKNGGTYTYLVKSFTTNTNIKPFIFDIDNFPGVEVIDLR